MEVKLDIYIKAKDFVVRMDDIVAVYPDTNFGIAFILKDQIGHNTYFDTEEERNRVFKGICEKLNVQEV